MRLFEDYIVWMRHYFIFYHQEHDSLFILMSHKKWKGGFFRIELSCGGGDGGEGDKMRVAFRKAII